MEKSSGKISVSVVKSAFGSLSSTCTGIPISESEQNGTIRKFPRYHMPRIFESKEHGRHVKTITASSQRQSIFGNER